MRLAQILLRSDYRALCLVITCEQTEKEFTLVPFLFYDDRMSKTITGNQLLGEIGEAAVRLRFFNLGFQRDRRSRLEAGDFGTKI